MAPKNNNRRKTIVNFTWTQEDLRLTTGYIDETIGYIHKLQALKTPTERQTEQLGEARKELAMYQARLQAIQQQLGDGSTKTANP